MTDHNITLYNTLTRRKEPFVPIDPSNVRMYVCGPTVYDYAHIGNARPIIVFDVLFRLLRHVYGEDHVTYARNITDVDDKINARAAEEYPDLPLNAAIAEVTTRTTQQFHEDIAALGVLEPSVEPRCTQHIPQMIAMIETLIAKGCAYAAEGHVLLDTQRVSDYGALSRGSLDDMIAGARVEVAPYKRNPADSVLWKPSSDDLPGWDSPWGRGRPGWHIECSAMAAEHLGEVFDIHGGGIDLVFPHHENEVAQSRCAHGTQVMANVWMHNGFLQVEGEKMSKSLGNFITIHELLKEWLGRVIRFNMLKTHYRQPINWTSSGLKESDNELRAWAVTLSQSDETNNVRAMHRLVVKPRPSATLVNALAEDLNTPAAISVLREHYSLAKQGNTDAERALLEDCVFLGLLDIDKLWVHNPGPLVRGRRALASEYLEEVRKLKVYIGNSLDTELERSISWFRSEGIETILHDDGHVELVAESEVHIELAKRVDELIARRLEARKAKNFSESDRIRDELAEMGIALKDGKDPETGEPVTTWEVKR